jgi:selenium metabolism protein YedF
MPVTDRPSVILIASECLGRGSDDLGRLLMKNFVITLLELADQPAKILLVNSGVLLAVEGSELIEPFRKLSAAGIEILSCGLCLDYFKVREKLAVGSITNMYAIADAMLTSGNTLRL